MAEKTTTKRSTEELDTAAEHVGNGHGELGAVARRAAVTALAAAVAGALGGAAKAMLDRRESDDGNGAARTDPEAEREQSEEQEERQEQDDQQEEDEQRMPVAEAEEDEPDEDADAPLTRDEHVDDGGEDARSDDGDRGNRGDRDDAGDRGGRQREPERGAAPNDVAAIVEQAKQQLRDVLGNEPESVSGLERSGGNWRVALEVVEVRRVPESTDVLASYEVVLDDDGGIVQMQRLRRYRRSQVDEGR